MKYSRTLFGNLALAILYCSLEANGIRSSTSLSSTSLQNGDNRSGRTFLLTTRGGSISDFSGIYDSKTILPNSISGGEIEAIGDDVEAASEEVIVEAEAPPSDALTAKSSKWRDLSTRILSAMGMIAFLGGLSFYFKEDGLTALVCLLQFMMFGEMTRTIGGDDWGSLGATLRKYWWFATAAVAFNAPKIFAWNQLAIEATAIGMGVSMGVVGSVLSFQFQGSGTVEFREFIRQAAVSLLSAILVVLPSSYWIGTLEEHGMKWIFLPAALVAINDIMAYVFGRLIGKHPLLPSISPKKTWEGFLGAALSTVGTAWVGLAENEGGAALLGPGLKGISRTDGVALAIVASTIAPFAGFLASVIKRAYGRKDFGNTFPGHGGFVDRLDCQLIMAPVVFFYLSLYKAAN